MYKVEPKEKLGNLDHTGNNLKLKNYDWKLIFQGLFPTLLIAIGAGMSIPFMNIYFEQTFDMSFDNYAALGFVTHCFVFRDDSPVSECKKQIWIQKGYSNHANISCIIFSCYWVFLKVIAHCHISSILLFSFLSLDNH